MNADDMNLFFHNRNITDFSSAQKEMPNATEWLAANKLTLNLSKAKYVLFNAKTNITITCKHCLSINHINIERPLLWIATLTWWGGLSFQ